MTGPKIIAEVTGVSDTANERELVELPPLAPRSPRKALPPPPGLIWEKVWEFGFTPER